MKNLSVRWIKDSLGNECTHRHSLIISNDGNIYNITYTGIVSGSSVVIVTWVYLLLVSL